MIAPNGPLKPQLACCGARYSPGKQVVHAMGCGQIKRGEAWARPTGPSARAMPVGGSKAPKVKRPNAGAMDEIAMRRILNDLGYVAIEDAWNETLAGLIYVAEFTFAPHERRWRCDFCLVVRRVAIEIDGGAHAAGKSKQRTDTEKRGELAARGYRVVTVTPEEVRDGTARDRLVRALDTHAAGAVGRQE